MKSRHNGIAQAALALAGVLFLTAATTESCGEEPVRKTERQCVKKYHKDCKIRVRVPAGRQAHGR